MANGGWSDVTNDRSETVRVVHCSGTAAPLPADDSTELAVQSVADRQATLGAVTSGDVDCVCVAQALDGGTTGLEVVAAVREQAPAVATVLYTAEPDGVVAADASRVGVTEYAALELLEERGETLADRVRAAVARVERERHPATASDDPTPGGEPVVGARPDAGAARVLDRIEDGFFATDADWRFTYVNRRAEEILQRSADELVGRNVWDEFPQAITDAFYEEYHGAMDTQEPRTFTEHFEPLNLWVEVSVYPSPDGLSIYFRDIGDRKRYEQALSELLRTTRELTAADSRTTVAEVAATAASEVLGFHGTGVRFAEDGMLRPVAIRGDGAADLDDERPPVPIADSPHGEAFRTGEPVTYEMSEGESTVFDLDTFERTMYFPLGDHGILSVGVPEGGFTETDRDLLKLLALSTTAALDRAARERELRRYRAVHESVREMVFVLDEAGRVTLATEALAERVGRDRPALEGRHARGFLPDADYQRSVDLVETLLSADESASRTMTTELLAGEVTIPVELELSLLSADSFRGTVGVVRDRSELAATRAELAAERDRFRHLFEGGQDPIAEIEQVDGEPIVRSVNPVFERVFGYDAATAEGRSLNDLILPPDHAAAGEALDDHAAAGEVVRREVERVTADGRRQFLYAGIPYDTAGDSVRGFAIYTDITEQKDRERQLQLLHRVLRHNLRNEMTVVLGNAGTLAERLDGEEQRLAEGIRSTARATSELSEQVRRIESLVEEESSPRLVDLTPLIEAVVERNRVPGVSITTELPSACRVTGVAELERAIDNVVENAVVHGAANVRVWIEPREGRVALHVSDDGPGIPERERAVLTGTREITQLDHSKGLDLWITRWIVDAAGGSLTFGEEADGADVILELERADPTDGSESDGL